MEKNVEIFIEGNWVILSKEVTEPAKFTSFNTIDLDAINATDIRVVDC